MAENEKVMDPLEAAKKLERGKIELIAPIKDGEAEYKELVYDFSALTGWELAKALDSADGGKGSDITEAQALCLFAAAAAKCTKGLDATDIRERLGAMDAVGAIRVAIYFFRGSLLAVSMRIAKE